MSRQQAIINAAKINRMIKNINYIQDMGCQDLTVAALPGDINKLNSWAMDLREYWCSNQDKIFAQEIRDIEPSDSVQWLLDNINDPSGVLPGVLSDYLETIQDLKADALCWQKQDKGNYWMLPEIIANDEAAMLLQRAVKAKILDKNYQPTADTKRYQLRMIADAIASILKLSKRNLYKPFHDLWGNNNYRLDSAYIPKQENREIQEIKALYPEYSFINRNQIQQPMPFVTTKSTDTLAQIYSELVSNGHIEESTPIDTWMAICGKADPDQIKPIVWKSGTRSLCYFTNLLFGNENRELLWKMVEVCFIAPNGSRYNIGTLTSSKSYIWHTQNISEYRPDLFYIANLK